MQSLTAFKISCPYRLLGAAYPLVLLPGEILDSGVRAYRNVCLN